MTLDEIRALKRAYITPQEAAEVLRCAPYALNVLYKKGQLPFKAIMVGNRLKIFRKSFLEAVD